MRKYHSDSLPGGMEQGWGREGGGGRWGEGRGGGGGGGRGGGGCKASFTDFKDLHQLTGCVHERVVSKQGQSLLRGVELVLDVVLLQHKLSRHFEILGRLALFSWGCGGCGAGWEVVLGVLHVVRRLALRVLFAGALCVVFGVVFHIVFGVVLRVVFGVVLRVVFGVVLNAVFGVLLQVILAVVPNATQVRNQVSGS